LFFEKLQFHGVGMLTWLVLAAGLTFTGPTLNILPKDVEEF